MYLKVQLFAYTKIIIAGQKKHTFSDELQKKQDECSHNGIGLVI